MFGVGSVDVVTPGDHRDWEFGHSCVNSTTISGVPNDEGVVFAQSSQESVVWTESKLLNTNLHSFENCDRFFGLEIPHDDWCIG